MTVRPALRAAIQGFRNTGNIAVDGVANTDPPVGSTTMTIAAVCRALRPAALVGNNAIVAHTRGPAGQGWRLFLESNLWYFQADDGATVTQAVTQAPSFSAGQVVLLGASYDTDTLRLRVSGVAAAPTGPYVGYSAPLAGNALTFGDLPISYAQAAEAFAFIAFLGSSTVGSDAAALAAIEASLQGDLINGRDLRASLPAAFGGAADLVYYDAEDAEPGVAWNSRTGTGVAMTPNLQLTKACYPVVL